MVLIRRVLEIPLVRRLRAIPSRVWWGLSGATFAGLFSFWMFFLPDAIDKFPWVVEPRYAQAFIGAGYLFRTAFFLYAAFQPNWFRLRWIVWGNLVFTGTLLLATYWHIDEFKWDPFNETPFGHIWLVLYIFEPVTMLYLIPRGMLHAEPPVSGGPLRTSFRRFLVLVAGILLMFGLLLVANPEFAANRWAWPLNPLDARIAAAWLLGWSAWCGTMAFARDWDEIRSAAALFILNGAALLGTIVVFGDGLVSPVQSPKGYAVALGLMTGFMIVFFYLQERRRISPP